MREALERVPATAISTPFASSGQPASRLMYQQAKSSAENIPARYRVELALAAELQLISGNRRPLPDFPFGHADDQLRVMKLLLDAVAA